MSPQTNNANVAGATGDAEKSMDQIMALCKRRGFIYPASEIYGGINGFWDYGPLGAILKKNLKDAWWRDMIESPPDDPQGRPLSIVPVDSCIIQNPKVWEASGHVSGFNDPMVDDKETKQRFRADHLYGLFIPPDDSSQGNESLPRLRDPDPSINLPMVATLTANSREEAEKYFEENCKKIPLNPHITKKHISRVVRGDLDPGPQPEIRWYGLEFADGESRMAGLQIVPSQRLSERDDTPSPFSGNTGTLTPPREFNLMFQTHHGAILDDEHKTYLRPETAQGIFVNYKNVLDSSRVRPPFGIAQIGKAFRNEVTPRNFTFRSREFEQMEIEFFCHPSETREWYEFWREVRLKWWESIGLAGADLQMREHDSDELAHYAKEGAGTSDIEFRFPFTGPGFGELEGVADRTDFDLRQHAEHSGAKLEYFDQERNERYLPHCVEPSAGVDRGVLALICQAFTPTPERKGSKYVMRFHPRMAPTKAAVFPLVNKNGMPEIAERLHRELKKRFGFVEYDAKQSIGKRYARMDEAGCPFCFTIDGQTLEDQTVTVRDRDRAEQQRLAIERVGEFLAEKLA